MGRDQHSERTENGENLKEATHLGFFEFLPDGAAIVDREGRIVQANAQLERIFGYSRDEIIGKPIEVLVPERFAARHSKQRKDFVSRPRRRYMGIGLELYGRRKDGSEFPIDIALIPIESREEMVVIAVVRDYTWRKRGEEAAFQLAAIVESSADAIIGTTLDGSVFSWNAGAERLYGYSPGEAKGRSISIVIPPDRRNEFPENLEKIRRGERIENYETVRVRKNGESFDVSLTISPIKDSAGNITGASTIVRDITDRKRAEEELKQVNEKLARLYEECEATNKELEAFTYSVSHDLRTPLIAAGGLTRVLLQRYSGQLEGKGKELLSTVYNEAERMRHLIDDLLAFSRSGRQALQRTEIDMNELVKSVAEELKLLDAGSVLQLNLNPLPSAMGDKGMIRQVVMNLLSNALKFSRPNPAAVIEVGGKVEDRGITYYVRDNGVGFDMADSDKIFEVFKRLHPSEEFEGTGIGLAIVSRIIQRHGGRVRAEGKNNEGATFYFTLPR